jgi:Mn-dependent DtxR family transcriptional regulator
MLDVLFLDPQITPREFMVFCIIASHMNPNGERSFPSTNTIAFRMNVSRRYVQRSISALKDLGYIDVCQRKRQVSVYSLGAKLRPLIQPKVVRTKNAS